ncbi:hypothetical protein [uncultured Sphingomonas sp.]|uniref:hypothetical protein n=1 Tax=uncultured Sphingomonas sp. TaxID=158754 RepID=UPI0035CABB3B
MSDENDWFAPKRFGLGAGLPIARQGWAVLLGFMAAMGIAAITLTPRHSAMFAAVALVLTLAFIIIAAQHTRGGWKWRWGSDE